MRRKEWGNVFGLGSRTPIAITLLVKRPNKTGQASISYHDIGDYIPQNDKLKLIKELGNICNPAIELSSITPNKDSDWVNQRDGLFETFVPIEPQTKYDLASKSFFVINSRGLETARDSWVYNSSKKTLTDNVKSMIEFYTSQIGIPQDTISYDASKISWSSSLLSHQVRGTQIVFQSQYLTNGIYRPFYKQTLYFGKYLIHRRGQWDDFFPTPQSENKIIAVSGLGGSKNHSVFISDHIMDLNCLDAGTQCFPLYYYVKQNIQRQGEFDFGDGKKSDGDYIRRDGISDFILKRCRELNPKITKEDIFYYVYGLLHSPDYHQRFSADLKKSLPHIPLPENYSIFRAFQNIGKKLADIHLNYESYPMNQDVLIHGENSGNYHVEKIRFISKDDKRTIIFNDFIQIENVPLKAYDYVLNGKSAIEWVMERYAITTDKASGIVNDPNQWSDNPRYILELLLRIIQVSVDTVDLLSQLPHWEF